MSRASFLGLIMFGIIASNGGCKSAYERGAEKLPPGQTARVALRVREARDSAVAALAEMKGGSGTPAGESGTGDGGKLDAASWDLRRRTMAIRDVLDRDPAGAGEAEGVAKAFEGACASLEGVVAGGGNSSASAVAGAEQAVGAAITDADRYLAAEKEKEGASPGGSGAK